MSARLTTPHCPQKILPDLCGCPGYLAAVIVPRVGNRSAGGAETLSAVAFVDWWVARRLVDADADAATFEALRQEGATCLVRRDFQDLMAFVLRHHPGLEFLQARSWGGVTFWASVECGAACSVLWCGCSRLTDERSEGVCGYSAHLLTSALPTAGNGRVPGPIRGDRHHPHLLYPRPRRAVRLDSPLLSLHTHAAPPAQSRHAQNYEWQRRARRQAGSVTRRNCAGAP